MVGIAGATRPGNAALVKYGIQTEQSHIRAHVCPVVKRVYIYPTEFGIAAIKSGQYVKVGGRQPGVSFFTSEGYLIPPFEIQRCVAITINEDVWKAIDIQASLSTSEKGKRAMRLVVAMLKNGLFPFPALVHEITDADLQISGADLLVRAGAIARRDIIIQVKCDFSGGEKQLGGSGNLFLQVAECNPLGRH